MYTLRDTLSIKNTLLAKTYKNTIFSWKFGKIRLENMKKPQARCKKIHIEDQGSINTLENLFPSFFTSNITRAPRHFLEYYAVNSRGLGNE